jgi:3-dehydroquinate dehydratase-2
MKILVLNGPNLNMLGIREKQIYGNQDYKSLVKFIKCQAKSKGVKAVCRQHNCEGKLVSIIQKAYKKFDGIVINAGAYTHTSIAILDALKSVDIPTVEVHISDLSKREDFRQVSFIKPVAIKTIAGKGFDGYALAIDELINKK